MASSEAASRVRGKARHDESSPSPASPPSAPRHPLPALRGEGNAETPSLAHVVTTLAALGKTELPRQLAAWLDALDETGRWALLKLVTGALRIGVSARLAKTAVAALGDKQPDEIELVWPGLAPPYTELFAWIEGRAEKPESRDPVPFRPVMLSHAIEEADFPNLDPADFSAEWKWDGIRVQAVAAQDGDRRVARLYSRTGEDVSGAFPGPDRRAHFQRRDRRRIADRARRPRAVVQRAATAAQPQNRQREADRRIPRAPARLRSAGRWRRRSARAVFRAAPRTARSADRATQRPAHRPLTPGAVRDLGRTDRGARRSGLGRRGRRCGRGRRRDAQAPRRRLPARPPERPVVEMEARSAHRRRRADVCAARPRQALVVLFRLYVRRLDRRRRTATSWCRSARPISASPTRS